MSDPDDDWGDPDDPTAADMPVGDPGRSAAADQPASHANDERPPAEPADPADPVEPVDESNPTDPDAAASGSAMPGDPAETGASAMAGGAGVPGASGRAGDPDLDVAGEAGVPVDASPASGLGGPTDSVEVGDVAGAGALGDQAEAVDPVDASAPGYVDGWGVSGESAEIGTSGVPGDVGAEGGPGEHLDVGEPSGVSDQVGTDDAMAADDWAAQGEQSDAGELGTDEAIAAIESAERVRDASKRAIEALVMVAEEPLASNLLGQLLEVSPVVVDRLCEELAVAYEQEGRGFQLVRVAGGWRYQSHPDQSVYVERFVLQGQTAKLSVAALETLAIVAYKQPVSRAQVASIRGVSVDGVMRTLEQRGYIAEIGKDPGPGQAVLFGTTPLFLEKVGLDNIDELPPLGDFVPGADVVEQLEQGLRPDRMPLRPEDAMAPGGASGGGGDDQGGGGFGDDGGFDLLAGMGEIAGISLSDDDRSAAAGGEVPGPVDTNGSGDDSVANGATTGHADSVWDLRSRHDALSDEGEPDDGLAADDRSAAAGGEVPGSIDTNGHGHGDDGSVTSGGAAAAYGGSVWDLRPGDESATPDVDVDDDGESDDVDLRDGRSGGGEGDEGLVDDE